MIVDGQDTGARRHGIVSMIAGLRLLRYDRAKANKKVINVKWKSKMLWSFVPTGVERLWIPSGMI